MDISSFDRHLGPYEMLIKNFAALYITVWPVGVSP